MLVREPARVALVARTNCSFPSVAQAHAKPSRKAKAAKKAPTSSGKAKVPCAPSAPHMRRGRVGAGGALAMASCGSPGDAPALASFTLLCVAEMSAMAEGVRISPEGPRLSAEAREPKCGLL